MARTIKETYRVTLTIPVQCAHCGRRHEYEVTLGDQWLQGWGELRKALIDRRAGAIRDGRLDHIPDHVPCYSCGYTQPWNLGAARWARAKRLSLAIAGPAALLALIWLAFVDGSSPQHSQGTKLVFGGVLSLVGGALLYTVLKFVLRPFLGGYDPNHGITGRGVGDEGGATPVVRDPGATRRGDGPAGEYLVSGRNPDGTTYQGRCLVGPRGEDGRHEVTWTILDATFHGAGEVDREGRLVVTYRQPARGRASYRFLADGSAEGAWEQAGLEGEGAERWRPVDG